MTISDYLNKYPEGTTVEIYVHQHDNYRRYHPEFVDYVEVDEKILNYSFKDLSVELFDKEEYLSRWDIGGYLDEDSVDNNTLLCFISNTEYNNFKNLF